MSETLHEVNGKKFLIKSDPTMTHVEEYRVGDQVMVLKKKSYGDEYEMFPGVIIGFYEFQALPTIHVAYLNVDYASAKVEFVALNGNTKGIEFARFDGDNLPYGKDRVITLLDEEVRKKKDELLSLEHKRNYFLECFGRYFVSEAAVKE